MAQLTNQGQVHLNNRLNWLQNIMFAIIVVLFLGFAGMFITIGQIITETISAKKDETENLKDKVTELNAKVDTLNKELEAQRSAGWRAIVEQGTGQEK